MQHVVQIAFDFDDSKVKEICESSCIKKVEDTVKQALLDKLLEATPSYYGGSGDGHATIKDPLRGWVYGEVAKHLNEWKDDIIAKAAHELAEHMRRSKTVREAFTEQLKEELK